MIQEDLQSLYSNITEANPKKLKQVIEHLISKSQVLIKELQEALETCEKTEIQRNFWKASYFNIKQACEKYIDSKALPPFNYISELQSQLKKSQIEKTCIRQKYKQLIKSLQLEKHTELSRKVQQLEKQKIRELDTTHKAPSDYCDYSPFTQSNSRRQNRNSPTKLQNKHKIGPKSKQFFQFGTAS